MGGFQRSYPGPRYPTANSDAPVGAGAITGDGDGGGPPRGMVHLGVGDKMKLGDSVELLLKRIGVTPSIVSRWLGRPCGCEERREKMNQLGAWARQAFTKGADRARGWLLGIIEGS